MTMFAAALALACTVGAEETPLEWEEDLASAFRRASREDKLVLVRQILCDCAEKVCASVDLAKKPAYLESESTRELVRTNFVPAITHVSPSEADAGYHHPRYVAPHFRRIQTRIRTLLVTAQRHVVHRLDLCPHSYEVAAELRFAVRILTRCYGRGGAAIPGGEESLVRLHVEHAYQPELVHPSLGKSTGSAALGADLLPSGGYQRGIAWHPDLEEAQRDAARQKKHLLYFQIVGDLDTGLC